MARTISITANEQARFERIFNSVSVGISLVTRYTDGHFTRLINDSHLRLCGLTREEAENPENYLRITHPDDRELQSLLTRQVDRGEITEFEMEKRYLRPDGEIIWVLFSLKRQSGAGGGIEEFTTVTDITERKRAEMFLDSILQNLPISVFIKEAKELRFVRINKAGEEMLGYSEEEVIGKNDSDLFPKAQAERFNGADRRVLDEGRLFEAEEEILTPHRGRRILHSRKIPLLGKDGRQHFLLGISEDITARKRSETALQELHIQLLETSRQAGMAEVATSVLHNVGNVLNSVNISCSVVAGQMRKSRVGSVAKTAALLREHADDLAAFLTVDPTGKRLPEYLGKLAEQLTAEQDEVLGELKLLGSNIDHIKDIVAMQQSYARVSGITEIINVIDLVEDSLRMNEESLARHTVRVVREYDEVPPITLEKHKALQILVNLIRNAKHACKDSGRDDRQLTLRVAAGLDCVRISVIDNGVGIPPANLTRIFAHGFTTKAEGHGFGLHSGALAATELGGSLTVHSDGAGTGATFTLELPLLCLPTLS